MELSKTWIEQCEAARQFEDEFGVRPALGITSSARSS